MILGRILNRILISKIFNKNRFEFGIPTFRPYFNTIYKKKIGFMGQNL